MNIIRTEIKGIELELETAPGVFSPRAIDPGTRAMLTSVELRLTDRVLDLGCGYGVVGILAARLIGPDRVVMLDNSEPAVDLARRNAVRNGVASIRIQRSTAFRDTDETGFTLILSNPPYHVDFSVPKEFIEKGFNRLVIGGRMVLVTKRRRWYEMKLRGIFGGVTIRSVDDYHVFTAEKRCAAYHLRAGPTPGSG